MLRLKGCPKCRGDIRRDEDHYGWYEQCIQCGYMRDLETADVVREPGSQMEKGVEEAASEGKGRRKRRRHKVRGNQVQC
ncbi:hypothetical protein ACFLYR_06960 [Chloroflexota bacterium]